MSGNINLGFLLLLMVCCSIRAIVLFGRRQVVSQLDTHQSHVSEASGLAASRIHSHILYTHNDRGDRSRFFAINATTGKMVAQYEVEHAANYDWEDMAIGPCADDCRIAECSENIPPSRYCLYIADIGNHHGDGAHNNIYMVREPSTLKDSKVDLVSTLKFSWTAPDADTVMISPRGELFVVSKIKNTGAQIAKLPNYAWGFDRVTLNMNETSTVKVVTTHGDPQGGDISPGGDEMLLVFEEGLYYYKIINADVMSTVADHTPVEVTSYTAEPGTESVAWSSDAGGFYTLPEGKDPTLTFYPKIPTVVG